jgi:PiT family inorganic phosphate transporter
VLTLLGGIYLGWALGSKDAANVFGTAVASRILTFRKASLLCAASVILGAYLQGKAGIQTLGTLTDQTQTTLILITSSAAVTISLMILLRLPVGTAQAVVGAIVGIGLSTRNMYWYGLIKVVISWLATPLCAMLLSVLIYRFLSLFFQLVPMGILTRDNILLGGLVVVGVYGSYALGANNVALVTGIFSSQLGNLADTHLALIGGAAMAAGILTFSRRMMLTVGSGIVALNAQTGFVAVLAMAVTTHIFAFIGVPVSTSQAIVGAIMGVGMIHGAQTVKFKMLRNIGVGWVLTPVTSLILSSAGYAIWGR